MECEIPQSHKSSVVSGVLLVFLHRKGELNKWAPKNRKWFNQCFFIIVSSANVSERHASNSVSFSKKRIFNVSYLNRFPNKLRSQPLLRNGLRYNDIRARTCSTSIVSNNKCQPQTPMPNLRVPRRHLGFGSRMWEGLVYLRAGRFKSQCACVCVLRE